MKIIHYRKNCIGCNACIEAASDYWEISKDDGKANLKNSSKNKNGIYIKEISIIDLEENAKAADSCPVRIIKIIK